eukprot:TRINITY_DN17036_c0_g2_i2.p1 TRINITY_DN17036_c0_g2~~TRINITY_DN17036_c0_g2_i2.p1  ORF type:complete len:215 (+),score=34.38 TRINITY_DN17036_c0_g2_i2:131-775(+)
MQQELFEGVARLMDGPESHILRVVPSSVPESGLGVFVEGHAPAGTVLSLYYGVVFDSDDLVAMHQFICPGNDYLIFRRDGMLIDGRPDGQSRMLYETAMARQGTAALDPQALPLHAVGSLVNHPPAGVLPNVATAPLDLHAQTPAPVLQFFQSVNANFRPAAVGDVLLKTVVMLAKRDIENEELWLDYNFGSDKMPEWYTPVDYQSQGDGGSGC